MSYFSDYFNLFSKLDFKVAIINWHLFNFALLFDEFPANFEWLSIF